VPAIPILTPVPLTAGWTAAPLIARMTAIGTAFASSTARTSSVCLRSLQVAAQEDPRSLKNYREVEMPKPKVTIRDGDNGVTFTDHRDGTIHVTEWDRNGRTSYEVKYGQDADDRSRGKDVHSTPVEKGQ
jgi:hypothetical protein